MNSMNSWYWGSAFLWTCALEQPIYVLFLRKRFKSWWAPCLLSLAVNALTHPLLWVAATAFPDAIPALECAVIAAEAAFVWLILRRLSGRKDAARIALAASAAANLLSWLGGRWLLARMTGSL